MASEAEDKQVVSPTTAAPDDRSTHTSASAPAFDPDLPDAPLCLPEQHDQVGARLLQNDRIQRFAAARSADSSVTWRRLLLAKDYPRQQRLIEAMELAGFNPTAVARTACCALHCWVFQHRLTGELRLRHYTCHNRFCLLCQKSYLRRVKTFALSLTPSPRHRLSFLTLTQKASSAEELPDAIERLVASFQRMRRLPIWRAKVTGGTYVLEITRGSGNWWHPHLHVVLDTLYWPLDQLQLAWGASCHIMEVKGDRQDALPRYLAKYLTKPVAADLYDNIPLLTALLKATRNRRLLQCFGEWRDNAPTHKAVKKAALPTEDPNHWVRLGELHELYAEAELGSLRSRRILTDLGIQSVQLLPGAKTEVERWREARAPPERSAPATLWTPAA